MINKNNIEKTRLIFGKFFALLIDLTIVLLIIVMLNITIINIWMNTYACLAIDLKRVDNILMILSIFIIPCLYFVISKMKYGVTIGTKVMKMSTTTKYSGKLEDCVTYDRNHNQETFLKCINKNSIIKIALILLLLFVIIQIIPPKLYIEKVAENREVYVFTKNKSMSDEKVFELIIEYDSNNPLENIGEDVGVRSFFPTQYETYSVMGKSPQTLSDTQKKDLLNDTYYTPMFEEVNTLTPVMASYDYSEKIIRYYWTNKYEKYEELYKLKYNN